jgi:hypothetical protein
MDFFFLKNKAPGHATGFYAAEILEKHAIICAITDNKA